MWQWDDWRAAILEMKWWVEWRVVIKESEGRERGKKRETFFASLEEFEGVRKNHGWKMEK